MSDFTPISGLWKSEGKNGTYLSGKTRDEIVIPAGSKLFVFINKRREKDTHPTHNFSFTAPDDHQQQAPAQDEWDESAPF